MKDRSLSSGQKLRYGAEAALFFAFMVLFRLLGLDRASALGGWIGRTVFSRLPPARTARANLKMAFPDKSEAEREKILTEMWDNLGRTVAEYPHLDKFRLTGPDPRLTITDLADAPSVIAEGKGVMFLSAHVGNWESMPITGELLGFPGATMVRHPNNPYVARWLERQRGLVGPKDQIGKHSGARQIFTQMRAGKVIYILVDQKNNEGIPVPFFGRDAMTTPVPAALALKMGLRILFAGNRRRGRSARFDVSIYPGLDVAPTGDEAADTRALTEKITARVEEMIRAEPSQWLWIHRRWPA